MKVQYCFIRREFFEEHSDFTNMLDPGNADKQSKRTHLGVLINVDKNKVYIPLRNNLGDAVRKYGKIGFSVPSKKRPKAGLDYRYALIINDEKYIEYHTSAKLPNAQHLIINNNFDIIEREINTYITRYIKVAIKKRVEIEPLFRNSSLINFHHELGIIETEMEETILPDEIEAITRADESIKRDGTISHEDINWNY